MLSRRALRSHIRKQAGKYRAIAEQGIWHGIHPYGWYFEACRHYDILTGSVVLYTRDTGHHTGGWWKNPAYERCYHLSLSFRNPYTLSPIAFDRKIAAIWCKEILLDMQRFAWHESPSTTEGKQLAVHHWRVFCDPAWKPILPPKEVYSREDTPADYKTTSER